MCMGKRVLCEYSLDATDAILEPRTLLPFILYSLLTLAVFCPVRWCKLLTCRAHVASLSLMPATASNRARAQGEHDGHSNPRATFFRVGKCP